MPTMPASLAASVERLLGRRCLVSEVQDVSAGLRRVVLEGEDLRGRPWTAGQEIEIRTAARELRHYTPRRFDQATGRMEILISVGHDGPGARWARALVPGTPTAVLGPGGRFVPRPGARQLFLGDATALGAFAAIADALVGGSAHAVPAMSSAPVPAGPGPARPARLDPAGSVSSGVPPVEVFGAVEVAPADLDAARILLAEAAGDPSVAGGAPVAGGGSIVGGAPIAGGDGFSGGRPGSGGAATLEVLAASVEPGAALRAWLHELDAGQDQASPGHAGPGHAGPDHAGPEDASPGHAGQGLRWPLNVDAVYLAGHAQTIQALRRSLTRPGGLDRRVVAAHAYWAHGRRGL